MGIKIYNLEKEKFEEESVCAESFMRFLYGSLLGKCALWAMFKRAAFSKIFGIWADSKRSAAAIENFVVEKNIDMNESILPIAAFKTWNDFFTRQIREDVRPIAEPHDDKVLSFPADGRHLLIKNIDDAKSFYAKDQYFSLSDFLGDRALAERFKGGSMLISRLSPLDYHRFHFPVGGELCARKLLNGALSSVSTIALEKDLSILWRNKRILNIIQSPVFDFCAFVEIGATNVGTIVNFAELGQSVKRGEQAGMFKFGGSCVVSIFPKSTKIEFDKKLVEMSERNIECYAKVNSFLGRAV